MNLRGFGRNAVIYAIGNIGLRAASFLIIPLYTHALTVEEFGLLVTLLTTMQFMIILMGLGSGMALLRFQNQYEGTSEEAELMGSAICINLAGGMAVTGIAMLMLPLFRPILHTGTVTGFILLTCFASLAQSVCSLVMSYYRSRNQPVRYMATGIGSAVLLLAANLIFLFWFRSGANGALLAIIAAYTITLLVISADILPRTGIRVSQAMFRQLFRFGFPLIFAMSGQLIMGSSSTYFLSIYSGLSAVAVYNLGYKLAIIMDIVLILPFQLTFAPFVYSHTEAPGIRSTLARLFSYFTLSLGFMSLFVLTFSKLVIPYMGPPEYGGAYIVVLFLLPAIAFKGVSYFGEVLLECVQKTHLTGMTVAFWAITCLVANYFFIHAYGMAGALIAANLSYILSGISVFILGMRQFPVPIQWRKIVITGGLLSSFLGFGFLLYTVSITVFVVAFLGVMLASGIILIYSGWFGQQEKLAFALLIQRTRSGITKT